MRGHLGHTTVQYAQQLGERVGVGRPMLFHHDPARTDAELESWDVGEALIAAAGDVHEV